MLWWLCLINFLGGWLFLLVITDCFAWFGGCSVVWVSLLLVCLMLILNWCGIDL